MVDPGDRGGSVEPRGSQRGDQTAFVKQPRVAVVVHAADGIAGADRQAARDTGGGAHPQAGVGGQHGGRPGRIEVHADDERARAGRAERVDRRGRTAQTFVDLQFRIKAQAGQQHRGVAAFQQRQIRG